MIQAIGDAVSAAALGTYGKEADGAVDHGLMYARSFFDLDGHGWQIMWLDPSAAEHGAEDTASPDRHYSWSASAILVRA